MGDHMRDRSERRAKARAGMTLIELMVALGVISIALFGILSMILYIVRTKEAQRELATAKQAAAARMEQIKAVTYPVGAPLPYSQYVVQQVTGVPPVGTSTTWNFSVANLTNPTTADKQGLGTITFNTLNPDIIDVTVSIEWIGARRSNFIVRNVYTKGY